MTKNKSKSSKGKVTKILLAVVILGMMSIACNDTGDNVTSTPTVEVNVGDDTANAIIEDTQAAVEDTVSALCTACLIGEKLGGDACNCNAICNAEVICKGE